MNELKQKQQNWPALTWDETDHKASIGPGQSRPVPGAKTKMFKIIVKPVNSPQLKVQFEAENARRAKRYALNRWPGAKVLVLEAVKR